MASHKANIRAGIRSGVRTGHLLSGALAMFVSQAAMAVGLGEIKLNSALNEPLNAEIELLNIGELSELEMLVGLASRKDFERADVPREFFLNGLQFTIDLSGGKPKVLVKSEKPVREPFLDFLVEMQWPSGRLMREYTVLIDLPIYSDDKAKAKTIDSTSSGSSPDSSASTKETTRPATRPAPKPDSSVATNAEVGGDYRVANGDTLWGVASRSRPQGASIHQTMVAIQGMNPGAFVRGDINMLKRGEVLRLPANHQITASHRQAVEEVAQRTIGALIDAVDSPTNQYDDAGNEPEGRLKLSTAVDNQDTVQSDQYSATKSDNSQANGSGAGSDALSNKLTIAWEELARKDRQLSEERERIAKLEQQLDTMQRMIEVGGTGLGETQQALSQVEEDAAVTDTADIAATADPLGGNQQEAGTAVAEADVETEVKEQAKSRQAKNQSDSSKVEAKEETGILAQYKYHILAGVGVLMALLLWLGLRRKKDNDNADEFAFDEDVEPVFTQPEVAVAAVETTDNDGPEVVEQPQPDDVDLSDDDQLFSADAFDLDDDEQETMDDAKADVEVDDSASEEAEDNSKDADQELLPVLEDEDETEQSDDQDDDLDFDVDLDLDDEMFASTDDDDLAEEDPESDSDFESEDTVEGSDDNSEELDSSAESTADIDDDFDLDMEGDEIATKMDLAKAYSDVGDAEGAREMLEEVIEEGTDEQKQEAQKLLGGLE